MVKCTIITLKQIEITDLISQDSNVEKLVFIPLNESRVQWTEDAYVSAGQAKADGYEYQTNRIIIVRERTDQCLLYQLKLDKSKSTFFALLFLFL